MLVRHTQHTARKVEAWWRNETLDFGKSIGSLGGYIPAALVWLCVPLGEVYTYTIERDVTSSKQKLPLSRALRGVFRSPYSVCVYGCCFPGAATKRRLFFAQTSALSRTGQTSFARKTTRVCVLDGGAVYIYSRTSSRDIYAFAAAAPLTRTHTTCDRNFKYTLTWPKYEGGTGSKGLQNASASSWGTQPWEMRLTVFYNCYLRIYTSLCDAVLLYSLFASFIKVLFSRGSLRRRRRYELRDLRESTTPAIHWPSLSSLFALLSLFSRAANNHARTRNYLRPRCWTSARQRPREAAQVYI